MNCRILCGLAPIALLLTTSLGLSADAPAWTAQDTGTPGQAADFSLGWRFTVANLISGRKEELIPHLARHMDVNAIADASGNAALSKAIGEDAAVNVKRVRRYPGREWQDAAAQGLNFIEAFTEIKTTWHPIGV